MLRIDLPTILLYVFLLPILNYTYKMTQQSNLAVRLELLWWLFTAIVLGGVLFPILREIPDYPFLLINAVFVIIFITFTRYVFLLKHTFIAQNQILKAIIVLVIVPFIFYLVGEINGFQTYFDEIGLENLMVGKSLQKQQSLNSYIRSEMLFFGVGSVIISIILPFRLIISVWRNRNKGTA